MAKEIDVKNVESRVLLVEDVELRVSDGDNPKISGYAAKFGKWSLALGGFTERIKAGAFDEALEISDVRALKNHDPNLLLGRTTSGTLKLSVNSVGLKYEVDPPDTTTGRDTIEEIRRKDITGNSFSFTVAEDDWKYNEDDTVQRTIIKFGELFDVGPVTYPAYPDTTVAVRSLEAFRGSDKKYDCECIECSHTLESEEHCKDIKCPECGGEMRRKDRPGVGRSESEKEKRERQFEVDSKYRHAGRIINRNKSADV